MFLAPSRSRTSATYDATTGRRADVAPPRDAGVRGRRRRLAVAALVLAPALAYAALVGRFVLLEPRLMFLPSAETLPPPPDLAPVLERVRVPASDGVMLHAWLLPPERTSERAGWALFFHGAGGNVSRETDTMRRLRRAGLGVVAAEYRGYGDAPGEPGERAMYADARTLYDWLVRERGIPAERIVLVGGSRGTAVSIELATQVPVAALVLEGSPKNKVDAMEREFTGVPVRRLMRHRFESDRRIGRVRAPMLFLHARADSVIPVHEARALAALATVPTRFVTLRGGHGAIVAGDHARWVDEVRIFLAAHTSILPCTPDGGCATHAVATP